MEELRVLMEATTPTNGELPSAWFDLPIDETEFEELDRKSTRLNSSHLV